MRTHKKLFVSMMVCIISLLALPLIVHADHAVINTNDGLVDAAWASISRTVIDGDDYADDNWDIQQAWVTNAADGSYFYFRALLLGKIPANDWSGVEALLDCNNDGDVSDANDVIIYFAPGSTYPDSVGACQGNVWPTTCGDYDTVYDREEIIGASPTNYEWRAPTTGTINYSACTGNIKVGFRTTYMESSGTYQFHDSTSWIDFNAPTMAAVKSLSSKTIIHPWVLLGLAGVLLAAAILARRIR